MVRSEHGVNLQESDGEYDSDLDINFITKLDDFDITNDETDIRNQFQLDPGVWTTPIKPITPTKVPNVFHTSNNNHNNHNNNNNRIPEHDPSRKFPTLQPPPGLQASIAQQQTNALQQFIGASQVNNAAPKILSVEEIERNIINQQQQQHHQKMMQEKLAAIQSKVAATTQQAVVPPSPVIPSPVQQQQQQQQVRKVMGNPPQQGLMFQGPPQLNGQQFAPIPPHLQGPNMTKFNPLMNINHPMNNMNNFHPNFGNPMMRHPQQLPPQMNRPHLPPHLLNMQGAPLMYQQQQQQQQQQNQMSQNSAQFNQRLVQEIQQNHPLLNPMQFQHPRQQMQHHPHHQQMQQQQMHHHNNNNMNIMNNMNNNNNHHQRFNNGKIEEYDEYANLMSNRDKQFLITIQLMQLNTETPYFDDYYYTMYKERQRIRGIENESRAHRDNQLNHPFTQPKGHAQMLLRQFNNIGKNGMQNQKNGMGRERRNSESSQKNDKENPTPRTYTPLQFENSLGKLQCGSVTAPRKIIDMEVVSNAESGQNSLSELTIQKKSRQILMHIEMLYKIVLKLEDFQHPMAIAASIILRVNNFCMKMLRLIPNY
jgi:DNA topoisomerase 2-associated protein PAT1